MSTTFKTSSEKTCRLSEFLACDNGRDQLNYHNLSVLHQVVIGEETLQIAIYNILDDYMDEIKENCILVNLTTKDKEKYFYNPDLLAYDLYGSVDLDFLIMKINGVVDPKDFDLCTLRLIPSVSTLSTILSRIYNAENEYLETNRELENIV